MSAEQQKASNLSVVMMCVCIVAGMGGLAYASVPLYELFCRVTGFGGTTQRAEAVDGTVLSRKVSIEFDANTNGALGWTFKPVQHRVTLKIGEQGLAFYRATNDMPYAVTGTATFNVTPPQAGAYFNKIECFCFTEQTLEPGQSVDMPVAFFIDPEIADDKNLDKLGTITLSYTFFRVDDPTEVSSAPADKSGSETAPSGVRQLN